jgi:large subunit ribosomal protein L1
MPNPKLGTVTKNIEEAVNKIKSGQIEYKTDKAGIVHASIGKSSFKEEEIVKNIKFFYQELNKTKPSTSKGVFIKKMFITSTMGPGLKVDLSSVI